MKCSFILLDTLLLCFPLTAVVDYLGFRILALASLPIKYDNYYRGGTPFYKDCFLVLMHHNLFVFNCSEGTMIYRVHRGVQIKQHEVIANLIDDVASKLKLQPNFDIEGNPSHFNPPSVYL